jgi:uncharacterized protein GlcG (DUF336 family)
MSVTLTQAESIIDAAFARARELSCRPMSVAVTGDTQERDEELAAYGIRAAGLMTDEGCAGLGVSVRTRK